MASPPATIRSAAAAFRPTVAMSYSAPPTFRPTVSYVATPITSGSVPARPPARDDGDADQIPQRRRRQWRQQVRPDHRRRPYRRASVHGLQSHYRGVGQTVPNPQLEFETHQFARLHLPSGSQVPNASSTLLSISSDGRFVAFSSSASNLVAGDRNGVTDFFVRDRTLGATELLMYRSRWPSAGGRQRTGGTLSGDGRYFGSRPTSLSAHSIRARAAAPTCMTGRKHAKLRQHRRPGQKRQPSASGISDISMGARFVAFDSHGQIWCLEIRTRRMMSSFAIARIRQLRSVSVSRQLECKGTAPVDMARCPRMGARSPSFGCDRSHSGHRSGTFRPGPSVSTAALSAVVTVFPAAPLTSSRTRSSFAPNSPSPACIVGNSVATAQKKPPRTFVHGGILPTVRREARDRRWHSSRG